MNNEEFIMSTLRNKLNRKKAVERLRAHFKLTGEFVSDQSKHGTRNAYTTYKCRCAECLNFYETVMKPIIIKNNQKYFQDAKTSYKENGVLPSNVSHGRTGYAVGCRCKICKRKNSYYAYDLRQKNKLVIEQTLDSQKSV